MKLSFQSQALQTKNNHMHNVYVQQAGYLGKINVCPSDIDRSDKYTEGADYSHLWA